MLFGKVGNKSFSANNKGFPSFYRQTIHTLLHTRTHNLSENFRKKCPKEGFGEKATGHRPTIII